MCSEIKVMENIWHNRQRHDSTWKSNACVRVGVRQQKQKTGSELTLLYKSIIKPSVFSGFNSKTSVVCFCVMRPWPRWPMWRTGLLLSFLCSCACRGKVTVWWRTNINNNHNDSTKWWLTFLYRGRLRPWYSRTAGLTPLSLPWTDNLQEFFHWVEERWWSGPQVSVGRGQKCRGMERGQRHSLSWCSDWKLVFGAANSWSQRAQHGL